MVEGKSGLVGALIAGIGFLIITTIVILVVVSTIDDADLLQSTAEQSSAIDTEHALNATSFTLAAWDGLNRGFTLTSVINASDGVTVAEGNYTFTSSTGSLVGYGGQNWTSVNISYSYYEPTTYENSTDTLIGGLTTGVDNVSGKLPTILLIGVVVLLLVVLGLLVAKSRDMGFMKSSGSL